MTSKPKSYTVSVDLPVGIAEAFAYHERPGCLQRLIPPWEAIQIESSDESLKPGSRVVLKKKIGGVPVRWVAEHTQYDPPKLFADKQVSGPFAAWTHSHHFAGGGQASQLTDSIAYELSAGPVGGVVGSRYACRSIEAMFAYRHRVTRDDLRLHAAHHLNPLSIAVSGTHGLVGRAFCSLMTLLGHTTRPIVRSHDDNSDSIAVWSDTSEAAKLGEVDVVVHLAGKPIADKRWTDEVKQQIRSSRIDKTRQLCESLAKLERKPTVLICASASGIYGDRGDEELTEASAVGDDFLARVARQWEEACQPAVDAGIRVVNARFGLVLSAQGGALAEMLTPAKFFGGALGNGQQWWSWIALDDVLGGIYHCIADESTNGPINFVAPQPIRNRDFAKTLGQVIGRPALVPAPATALRVGLGEMADALLLASARLRPVKLMESGYEYRFTDLREALRYSLGYERRHSEA